MNKYFGFCKIFVLIFVIVVCIQTASALECYICSDCQENFQLTTKCNGPSPRCMARFIYKNTEEDPNQLERTVRGCAGGNDPTNGCNNFILKPAVSPNHLLVACSCSDRDLCNGSTRIQKSTFIWIFLGLIIGFS